MPKDKNEMHNKIVSAAMDEFLQYGFEKSSMRRIASSAGLTAAGIYNHFDSKEEMFSALVEPVVNEFMEMYRSAENDVYSNLENENPKEFHFYTGNTKFIMEYIYDHLNEFKLLVCKSQGTRYENFVHDIAELEEKSTLGYFDKLRENGINVVKLPEREFHLFVTTNVNAMAEAVAHNFTRDEAMHYAENLDKFFTSAWSGVLGLE